MPNCKPTHQARNSGDAQVADSIFDSAQPDNSVGRISLRGVCDFLQRCELLVIDGQATMHRAGRLEQCPLVAPSVTAWAHTAFPELRADPPTINLATTAALDPNRTIAHPTTRHCDGRVFVRGLGRHGHFEKGRQTTSPPLPRNEVIYVIAGGWHTELSLPLQVIGGPLAALSPTSRTHGLWSLAGARGTIIWPETLGSGISCGRPPLDRRSCS